MTIATMKGIDITEEEFTAYNSLRDTVALMHCDKHRLIAYRRAVKAGFYNEDMKGVCK